jgi:hypothetical protein
MLNKNEKSILKALKQILDWHMNGEFHKIDSFNLPFIMKLLNAWIIEGEIVFDLSKFYNF